MFTIHRPATTSGNIPVLSMASGNNLINQISSVSTSDTSYSSHQRQMFKGIKSKRRSTGIYDSRGESFEALYEKGLFVSARA